MHKCPYCESTDLTVKNILHSEYFMACHSCGMTGPVGYTEEHAVQLWAALEAKMCRSCISRPWGKKMLKRVAELAKVR